MQHPTYFDTFEQVSAAAAESLGSDQWQIIHFNINWCAMTCLAHEDCSAGVMVHQAGTKFSIVYTSAAYSGSNITQQPVLEERLELAKTGGDEPYEFLVGHYHFYVKKKRYCFDSKMVPQGVNVFDVYADGQCGFRALAMRDMRVLINDEDEGQHFYPMVRLYMEFAVEMHRDAYIEAAGDAGAVLMEDDFEKCYVPTMSIWDGFDRDFLTPVGPGDTDFMLDLNAGQVAADALGKLVVIVNQSNADDESKDEKWHLYVPQVNPKVSGDPVIILLRSYDDDAPRNHYCAVMGDIDLTGKCQLGLLTHHFVSKMFLADQQEIQKLLLVPIIIN
ncbi:hypothetical protein BC940DRAFT_318386 [Gongronella butleri]|nr:hypothetical protein BC940DRAFT_318386 [Gongronella butleri]